MDSHFPNKKSSCCCASAKFAKLVSNPFHASILTGQELNALPLEHQGKYSPRPPQKRNRFPNCKNIKATQEAFIKTPQWKSLHLSVVFANINYALLFFKIWHKQNDKTTVERAFNNAEVTFQNNDRSAAVTHSSHIASIASNDEHVKLSTYADWRWSESKLKSPIHTSTRRVAYNDFR